MIVMEVMIRTITLIVMLMVISMTVTLMIVIVVIIIIIVMSMTIVMIVLMVVVVMFVGVALFPTDKVMMWISSKLTRVPYYIGLLHINLLKTTGINF